MPHHTGLSVDIEQCEDVDPCDTLSESPTRDEILDIVKKYVNLELEQTQPSVADVWHARLADISTDMKLDVSPPELKSGPVQIPRQKEMTARQKARINQHSVTIDASINYLTAWVKKFESGDTSREQFIENVEIISSCIKYNKREYDKCYSKWVLTEST